VNDVEIGRTTFTKYQCLFHSRLMPICWVGQVSVELMTAPSKAMHKSTSGNSSSSSSSGLRVKITLRFSLSLLLFFVTC